MQAAPRLCRGLCVRMLVVKAHRTVRVDEDLLAEVENLAR